MSAAAMIRRQRSAAREMWLSFRPVLWLFLLLLATSAVAGAVAYWGGIDSPLVDVVVTVVDAAIILAYVGMERESVLQALRRHGLGGRTPLLMVGLLVGFAAFMYLYFGGLGLLGIPSYEYLPDFEEHGWPLWSAFVLISLCPAIFEELAFRGFIQGRLETILRPGEALTLQAAMFSIIHLAPVVLPSHFVMGLVFGWVRRRTGSLVPGMILHGVWNALVLVHEML
jgi:membrane protease YdiL (CAAX protease family)